MKKLRLEKFGRHYEQISRGESKCKAFSDEEINKRERRELRLEEIQLLRNGAVVNEGLIALFVRTFCVPGYI